MALAIVTLIAALLCCGTLGQVLAFRRQHPNLLLEDPPRTLFDLVEHGRRLAQANRFPWLPRIEWTICPGCSMERTRAAWDDLIDEQKRLLQEGKWLPPANAAEQTQQMRWASIVTLAGWGDEQAISDLRELADRSMPDYLERRALEITSRKADSDRTRGWAAAGWECILFVSDLALLAFGLVAGVIVRRQSGTPASRGSFELVTPARAILVAVWSLALMCFVLYGQFSWGFEPLWRRMTGLPLCISVIALLLATRTSREETPIRNLIRLPNERGQWVRFALLALFALAVQNALCYVLDFTAASLGYRGTWSDIADELVFRGMYSDIALTFFSDVVLAPFGEELVFRGLLFGALTKWMSVRPAAIASAVVFSGMHGYDWVGFFSVALSGYIYALLYARTNSLVPGMLTHAGTNLVACVFLLPYRL